MFPSPISQTKGSDALAVINSILFMTGKQREHKTKVRLKKKKRKKEKTKSETLISLLTQVTTRHEDRTCVPLRDKHGGYTICSVDTAASHGIAASPHSQPLLISPHQILSVVRCCPSKDLRVEK